MGPVVPGTTVPNGAKVPGTPFQLVRKTRFLAKKSLTKTGSNSSSLEHWHTNPLARLQRLLARSRMGPSFVCLH